MCPVRSTARETGVSFSNWASLVRPIANLDRSNLASIPMKLGLNLVSEQTDKGRVCRIKDGKALSGAVDRVKQAA